MSNQTIDGVMVRRQLLEKLVEPGCESSVTDAEWDELRAPLDAPAKSPDRYEDRAYCEALEQERDYLREQLQTKPSAQPQGEPVAWLIQCQHSGLVEQAVPNDKSDYPEDWSDSFPVYREQPSQDNALKAFANDMITAAFEGGSFDGGDIQDIAVKHGLLRIEQRTEECGDVCACRSEGDGFPAECYRKTALLRGDQPAPVAVVMSFDFEHPSSKERRTVALSKQDVFDGMEDYFYDKIGEQICRCESVGETNVVDCSCDEYVHDFEIVKASLTS